MYECAVLDIERGQLPAINPAPANALPCQNSWGYTEGNHFKTPYELICNLIDVVSKNGCLMLNVGPKADGTICDEEAHAAGNRKMDEEKRRRRFTAPHPTGFLVKAPPIPAAPSGKSSPLPKRISALLIGLVSFMCLQ